MPPYTITPWELPDFEKEYEDRISLSEEELRPKSLKEQCTEVKQWIHDLPSHIKNAIVGLLAKKQKSLSHERSESDQADDSDKNEGEN